MHADAADAVRAGDRGELAADGGVLREAEGAPGELLLPVQEGPEHEEVRQLAQRQEGLRHLQGSPAQMLSTSYTHALVINTVAHQWHMHGFQAAIMPYGCQFKYTNKMSH